jgi:ATP-dependent DNA ligase
MLRPTPFNDPAWLFEPKYDGFRSLVYLTGGQCMIYSRRGNRFSKFQGLRRPRASSFIAIEDEGLMHLGAIVKGRGYFAATALEAR